METKKIPAKRPFGPGYGERNEWREDWDGGFDSGTKDLSTWGRGYDLGEDKTERIYTREPIQSWGFEAEDDPSPGSEPSQLAGEAPVRPDDAIYEDVCRHIGKHRSLDAAELRVEVTNGQVIMMGAVSDYRMKQSLENDMLTIPGVTGVSSKLTIVNSPYMENPGKHEQQSDARFVQGHKQTRDGI